MDRRNFLMSALALPISAYAMKINALSKIVSEFGPTKPMPVLFLGHGSPMNAIELNEFSKGWRTVGKSLPVPNAVLCISAHWETKGTFVTAMQKPRTIHDFGGFPQELFDVQYPAPGSPELALEAQRQLKMTEAGLDESWGLDHGAWSVIKHLYPEANIPVIQLSLDYSKSPQYHYDLAGELAELRKKGILIVGSGNMVHNLRTIDWRNPDSGFDWAVEADTKMREWIAAGNHQALIDYEKGGKAFSMSIPTPEHYLPLLYTLGLQGKNEEVSVFNAKTIMGSISMTSVKIG
ncbi:MAG: 4,5-DOPA dioxygenase extradiol [Bacteroidales bacterium]|nr:4,5-DOPA dioxygenase extradiol [Bacteroidales bacterium]